MNDTGIAVEIIENTSNSYTILRGVYMTNKDKIDFQLTEKEQPYTDDYRPRYDVVQ